MPLHTNEITTPGAVSVPASAQPNYHSNVTLGGTPPPLNRQVGGGHYKDMKIQPLEYCHANNIGKIEGDVIAYVSRWRKKNGLEDLRKAVHELEILIQLEEAAGTKEV